MELIVKVTSATPTTPLSDLLRLPLGLDIWEVKPDYLILRAPEAPIERLTQMGYGVEPLQPVADHLRAFATTEAIAGYHSAETLEQDLRQLAETRPEIAELREIGRSVENRPIWALRIGERKGSLGKGAVHGLPSRTGMDRRRGAVPAGPGTGRAGR